MEFCDLKKQYLAYKKEIDSAIQSIINSSSFINGSEINLLEEELANYTGVKNAICCSSGTDALLLSLMAYDIKPGDEIICPAFSYIASASMISFYKAKPVFVDVSLSDFNIDASKIEEKITSKTKGIIAVSLFGQCANFAEINSIAKKHGLWVIEDGAQSFGASYFGKFSGNLTEVGTTSFFPAKPLGCYGDGGALFTNDDELAEKIKMLRGHGQEKRYAHKYIGINGRMDTLQAAILRVKLKYFNEELAVRNRAAKLYSHILKSLVETPQIIPEKTSTWAQYTIRTKNRDGLKNALQKQNISSIVHYPIPLPKQEAFKNDIDPTEKFPIADELSETVLSLPIHGLITEKEIETVAGAIKTYFTHE
ncbi:DegT/DnrJ/EryC1/StrS family aminotransferase [Sunxiuqinia sp. A32]|uniref:DegT/DnrJ/EryC1/StrS family aminotransferase n=1 Tax=Sunxiuqinia sp. A32 TaxID=3461496 RepID=UPI0040463AD6